MCWSGNLDIVFVSLFHVLIFVAVFVFVLKHANTVIYFLKKLCKHLLYFDQTLFCGLMWFCNSNNKVYLQTANNSVIQLIGIFTYIQTYIHTYLLCAVIVFTMWEVFIRIYRKKNKKLARHWELPNKLCLTIKNVYGLLLYFDRTQFLSDIIATYGIHFVRCTIKNAIWEILIPVSEIEGQHSVPAFCVNTSFRQRTMRQKD